MDTSLKENKYSITMLRKINPSILLLSLVPLGYILKGIFFFDVTLVVYIALYLLFFANLIFKKGKIRVISLDVIFMIWTLLAFASLFNSDNYLSGFYKFSKLFFLEFSLLLFIRTSITNKKDFFTFVKYYFNLSVFLNYIIILDCFLGGRAIGRYAAFGGEVNAIALSTLGSMTSLVCILLYIYNKIHLKEFVITIVPSISVLLLAASKGAIVSLGATLLFFLPVIVKRIRIKTIVAVICTILLLSRLGFVQIQFNIILSRFINLTTSQSTMARVDIINTAMQHFFDHPFFGTGIGTLKEPPHNIIIELLAENGLLVLTIFSVFLLFITYCFCHFVINNKNDFIQAMIYGMFFNTFINLLFSYTYVDNKYLFISIGLFLTFISLERSSTTKKLSPGRVQV